jgi:23S rRNA (uracil1939-C5)-methyltransferase
MARPRGRGPSAGDVVELTIDKAAAGGAMIARLEGQVVFVSGAIPGERVMARVERAGSSLAHARVTDVIEPSPDRRDSFADPLCGGALYGHIGYPRQLAIKSQVIADTLARIGKIILPDAVSVAPSAEDGYRMRARLHVRGQRLGFFREGTHDVCDVRPSRQLLAATCDTLDRLMAAARSLGVETIREVDLSENLDASERVVHFDATPPLDVRTLDALEGIEGLTPGPFVTDRLTIDGRVLMLRRHVLAFFQGNRHLLRELVMHVSGLVPERTTVVDLYAGTGLFAVAAAVLRDASVVAVEGDRYAAHDLEANAAASGRPIATTHVDVETFLTGAGSSETVIVDPPRTGMSPPALAGMLRLKPRRLVYVSCDVATLARDARALLDAGYRIDRADAFDLFPNTPHVETVVVFENLRSSSPLRESPRTAV